MMENRIDIKKDKNVINIKFNNESEENSNGKY